MGDEAVPYHRLERLDQRSLQLSGRVDDDGDVGECCQRSARSADNSVDRTAELPTALDGVDEVDRDAVLTGPASDAEHQERVPGGEPGDRQPFRVRRVPAVVVGARCQLRDIVGRRVALHPAELAEVVDRVRCVPGTSSDAEDEEPSPILTHLGQAIGHGVQLSGIDRAGQVGRGLQVASSMRAHDPVRLTLLQRAEQRAVNPPQPGERWILAQPLAELVLAPWIPLGAQQPAAYALRLR